MSPEEQLQQSEEIVPTKHVLHTVTPFSKYLALVLFIILPFIGGWIGYNYSPEKIVEVDKAVIKEVVVEINSLNSRDVSGWQMYDSKEYDFEFQPRAVAEPLNRYRQFDLFSISTTGQRALIISDIGQYIPELQQVEVGFENDSPIILRESSMSNILYFVTHTSSAGCCVTSVQKLNLNTGKIEKLRNISQVMNGFVPSNFNPLNDTVAYYSNLDEEDKSLFEIRVANLFTDTSSIYSPVFSNNETPILECGLVCTGYLKWLSETQIQYGVFDDTSEGFPMFSELIEYRSIDVSSVLEEIVFLNPVREKHFTTYDVENGLIVGEWIVQYGPDSFGGTRIIFQPDSVSGPMSTSFDISGMMSEAFSGSPPKELFEIDVSQLDLSEETCSLTGGTATIDISKYSFLESEIGAADYAVVQDVLLFTAPTGRKCW